MPLDRRAMLALTAALPAAMLPAGPALAQGSPAPGAPPSFPPPVPDVPSTKIQDTPLAARNAEIIRRQNAAHNSGDVNAAAAFFAVDTRNHGVAVGRKGVLRVLTDIVGTFPDYHADIFDLMAMDDMVVIRTINTGTHKGVSKIPFDGGLLVGVPPTGKRFKVQSIHWWTLKDGLIVEHRASRDDIGMMQQLGLLPMTTRYDLPKV